MAEWDNITTLAPACWVQFDPSIKGTGLVTYSHRNAYKKQMAKRNNMTPTPACWVHAHLPTRNRAGDIQITAAPIKNRWQSGITTLSPSPTPKKNRAGDTKITATPIKNRWLSGTTHQVPQLAGPCPTPKKRTGLETYYTAAMPIKNRWLRGTI